MKLIEFPDRENSSRINNVLNKARLSLVHSEAQKEADAQDVAISALQRVLDNRFFLLRGATLEGPDIPIPLILVGPPGIWMIYASGLKGVYRAREDIWEELDDRSKNFHLAKPNLLTRTSLMARAVGTYLTSHGFNPPETEPVLFFSEPGVHVDTSRPSVRVVMADALDRFVASLLQSSISIEPEMVQRMVDAIAGAQPRLEPEKAVPENDVWSFKDLPPEEPVRPVQRVIIDKSESPLLQRIPFTRRQWGILGMMALLNVIILSVFVVLILFT